MNHNGTLKYQVLYYVIIFTIIKAKAVALHVTEALGGKV
jgi:hypothetical protein